jgi:glycosyltransferase involved in cell wall biosynthesis
VVRVLLLHSGNIPHYRVPVYNYLSRYLERCDFALTVAAGAVQPGNPHPVEFRFIEEPLSAVAIGRMIYREKFDVIILFVDLRHLYLFPTYFIAKGLMRRKMVWWGQGRNLLPVKSARLKDLAYTTEHALCDSIILYADHLKKYVHPRFHHKIFVANNTLSMESSYLSTERRLEVLDRYGIKTSKNIICAGRLQRRKRLDRLVEAVERMNRPDVGVILVGPDAEGVLAGLKGENVYAVGPVYGQESLDLLSAADVYCLPGAVGLSIVDAFHCGLPFVTEEGDESAEIMYLRDGVNGFIVPRGDIDSLSAKLQLLLDDANLRRKFSEAARKEVAENAHIDRLCEGFRAALQHATGPR